MEREGVFSQVVEGSLLGTFCLVGLIFLLSLFSYLGGLFAINGMDILIASGGSLFVNLILAGFFVIGGIVAGWVGSENTRRYVRTGAVSGVLASVFFFILRLLYNLCRSAIASLNSGSLILVGSKGFFVALVLSSLAAGIGGVIGSVLRTKPYLRLEIK